MLTFAATSRDNAYATLCNTLACSLPFPLPLLARKRLLDGSILEASHASLIGGVLDLYQQRLEAQRQERAARLAVHADSIRVSLLIRCSFHSCHHPSVVLDGGRWIVTWQMDSATCWCTLLPVAGALLKW